MLEHKSSMSIRVYAVIMDKSMANVLIANEIIRGEKYTKFPGGGLEWGEGVIDCLKRELKEESGKELQIANRLYITEDFVKSNFDHNTQIICIYYLCHFVDDHSGDIPSLERDIEFEWHPINNDLKNKLSFKTDQGMWGDAIEQLKGWRKA